MAPSGNVEWMCLPRFDGPSIFGAMLDRDAGTFRLAPVDTAVPAGRRYLPGTMVLETTWGTRTGWVIVRDVLLIGPWHHDDERSNTHRRSPTDHDADHVLLRTMRCVNGRVEMHMECEPRSTTGASASAGSTTAPATARRSARAEGEAVELTLTTDLRIGFEGGRARARTTLRDGDTAFVALSWSEHGGPETYDEAYHRLVYTADFWHEWLSHGEFPDHPWRTYLQRSALTLKGLTYAPTGAMVAAPTTSLPETPGGERNWDYRYAWIRDSTFMLWGLYTLGFDEEANDFFYFIRDVAARTDDELQIMYGIGGERELTEEMLLHLDGYERAQPVRVGNGAYAQQQHDVWGALLDSIYLHTQVARRAGRVDVGDPLPPGREGDRRLARARPRDLGGARRAAALHLVEGHVLGRLRPRRAPGAPARGPRARRALAGGRRRDPRRRLRARRRRARRLRASTTTRRARRLVPAASRSCASCRPTTSAIIATVNAIADELTVDGLVLRYKRRGDRRRPAGEEGTFAICSFWLVSALAEIGEHDRARALCEKMLGYASPLDLYAEEIDARSGRHLGNFPQAFTHLALINAVMHVIRADHELASAQPLLESRRRKAPRHERSHRHPLRRRRGRRRARRRGPGHRHRRRARGARRGARRAVRAARRRARLRALGRAGARLGATCTSGTATSAACRSTTRSRTTAWPPSTSTRPGATWHPVRRRARPARAPRRPTRAELGDTCSTSRSTAWAPTATPPRCSPASRRSTPDGVCLAVRDSPKPPPERVTLTLGSSTRPTGSCSS